MPDRITTLIQGGVTNALIGTALASYLAMDPFTIHQYANDFDVFASGDWTNTHTGTPTNGLTAGNGGILSLVNSAASADLDQLTLTVATFAFNPASAAVWFKARFQVANATNAEVVLGLQNLNTNALAATDGIWFQKNAATTSGNFIVSASSTQTVSSATVTLANNTYVDIGFHYNGGTGEKGSLILLYANGQYIGSMVTTNLPATGTNLALTIAVANGTAASNTLLLDYIMAAVERDQPTQLLGA